MLDVDRMWCLLETRGIIAWITSIYVSPAYPATRVIPMVMINTSL
ncbi:MAG: hypothetical protein ACFFD4_20225 [Candidatus Odinarchaeota archaeon]